MTAAPTLGSHLLFFLMNLSSFRFMRYTTGLEVIRGLLFSQSVSFTFQSPNLQVAGVGLRLSRARRMRCAMRSSWLLER